MNEPKYCKSCGAYIPDRFKKCLACGFPVDIPSLAGNPDEIETTTLKRAAISTTNSISAYKVGCVISNEEKPDIDLDSFSLECFLKVKRHGKISQFAIMSIETQDHFVGPSGRTIDGRLSRDTYKKIINLRMIER